MAHLAPVFVVTRKCFAGARPAPVVWLLAITAGCGSKGEGERTTDSTSRVHVSTSATLSGSASAEGEAAAPRASARPAGDPEEALDPAEFCARALKLSEANAGKCTPAEQQNLVAPALDAVKRLDLVKTECDVRVTSPKATFDSKVAFRCIQAAEKRGGLMTFYRFSEIPECHGVVTGTATEKQPVLYAEECAPGLAWVNNRCAKPGTKNALCARGPSGILGDPSRHVQCEDGLACLYTRYPYEGDTGELRCLDPTPIGGPCRLRGPDPRLTNLCPSEATCYQGKCREKASEGGDCMTWEDCGPNLRCEIKGGVFGRCVASDDSEKCLAEASR